PAYVWPRRGGPSYAGRPADCQAQVADTGQSTQRGVRAVHTRAPSSMTATAQRAAVGGSRGRRLSARFTSAFVCDLGGYSSPEISRARTRRTLVSRTACRCPNAKLATAAAVYAPMPGGARRSAWDEGTSPPCRSVMARAVSWRRSARRG